MTCVFLEMLFTGSGTSSSEPAAALFVRGVCDSDVLSFSIAYSAAGLVPQECSVLYGLRF